MAPDPDGEWWDKTKNVPDYEGLNFKPAVEYVASKMLVHPMLGKRIRVHGVACG